MNVAGLPGSFNLYGVVNSTLTATPFSYNTDFPAGPIPECDYTNNSDYQVSGCCGVANAGSIDGFEQNCSSFDPVAINSSNPGGGACTRSNVYNNTGTENSNYRLNYSSTLPGFTADQMDNIKVYNTSLSDAEVLEAKNNCSYRNNGGLQAWWNFDSNTGLEDAVDLIGSADLTFSSGNPTRTTPGGTVPDPAPIVYEWEEATNIAGPWSAIPSSDSETLDPSTISQTTYFRRGIVNSGSCENSYSEIVEKRIGSVLNNGGAIGSDEEACPGFMASILTESAAPDYI